MVPENTVFCFDLRADPGETRDLWGTRAGEPECSRLKQALDRQLSLLKLASCPPTSPSASPPR